MTEPQPPPLQADSPATLPDGSVVPRFRPPEVGGGSFAVDLARAPEAIRELEQARDELNSIRRDAVDLALMAPPANDKVSRDATEVLGLAANGGPGSFVSALDGGVAEIESMIADLRTALQVYRDQDEQAAADVD